MTFMVMFICPPQSLNVPIGVTEPRSTSEAIVNLEYTKWIKHDSLTLCWIDSTLSKTILSRTYGLFAARDVWLRLERLHLIQISISSITTSTTNLISEEGNNDRH